MVTFISNALLTRLLIRWTRQASSFDFPWLTLQTFLTCKRRATDLFCSTQAGTNRDGVPRIAVFASGLARVSHKDVSGRTQRLPHKQRRVLIAVCVLFVYRSFPEVFQLSKIFVIIKSGSAIVIKKSPRQVSGVPKLFKLEVGVFD